MISVNRDDALAPTPAGSAPSVLLVTLTPRVAGAERVVMSLLEGLREGYSCHLGLLTSPREHRAGLPWQGPVVRLRSILFGRFDLIHSHLFLPGLVIRIRRIWDKRFRWVHTVHYHDYRSLRLGFLKRWLDHSFVFPAPDRLVAVSEAVQDGIPPLPNVVVVRNGVELSPAEGMPRRDEAAAEGPVLGTVAMLRPEKGIRDLILAAARLAETQPHLRLRIAGDGPLMGTLGSLVKDLELEGRVEFLGYVKDLDPFYAGLDLFVQPSLEEGFGLAVLDAMRFRIPVVASAVGYLPRLLGNGRFGLLVQRGVDFPQRLALGVEAILAEPSAFREKASAGLDHWSTRLNSQAMIRGYQALYSELLRPGVCMIAPIITHSTGGLQRQIQLQTRELVRRGYAVYLLQRRDRSLSDDPAKAREWKHVRFLSTPDVLRGMEGPGRLPERARGLVFIAAGILQILRMRHRITFLHAHQLYSPTLVGVMGRLLFMKPLVVKVTASGALGELTELKRLPFQRLRRLAFRFIDRIIVLTPAMEGELTEAGFDRARVILIPNGVELPPSPVTYAPGEGPFRLLFTGRLSSEKSLETVIRAVDLLARDGLDVRLDLVGGADPDRDASAFLRGEAEKLEDPSRIVFHGYRTEMEPFYRRADAFVLPSESEGMSNALLEALSHGLVCLASDIPPNRFLIQDGENGFLFRQGSPEELAGRIRELVADAGGPGRPLALRLSAAARSRVEERFSAQVVGEKIAGLYQELMR